MKKPAMSASYVRIVIGTVFDIIIKPENEIYKQFHACWPHLKQDDYKTAASELSVKVFLKPECDSLLMCAKHTSANTNHQKIIQKYLELIILFLGGWSDQGVLIAKKPGAFHRAWWISKVLYSFKIWMFLTQVKLMAEQKKGLEKVVLFAVLVYSRAWFKAPVAVSVPVNDQAFL